MAITVTEVDINTDNGVIHVIDGIIGVTEPQVSTPTLEPTAAPDPSPTSEPTPTNEPTEEPTPTNRPKLW